MYPTPSVAVGKRLAGAALVVGTSRPLRQETERPHMFALGGLSLRVLGIVLLASALLAGQIRRSTPLSLPQEAPETVEIPVIESGLDDGSVPASDESTGRAQSFKSRQEFSDGLVRIRRVCRVTAYCDRGITASGRRVGPGQCAAPANIPFGAKVYIPALGRSFVVTDRTHRRFRHNTVDIFLPSRDLCVRFGRKYLECEFLVPAPRGAVAANRVPPAPLEIVTKLP